MVDITKFNTNLNFFVVDNTKTNKKRVDNIKFDTNLIAQAVYSNILHIVMGILGTSL